ncbi:MAG: hypoxanthine phosphoribosyltransferase [Halanaerobiales bacterium]|nr:hypoxanthine phosphoribosyltransferase [Halanaerobiales bacterium]
MNKDNIGKIIISKTEIEERVKDIADSLNKDYKDKEPLLVGILKGSIYFLSDLSRLLNIDHNIDFLSFGRFKATSGEKEKIKITKDLDLSIRDRDVIVIEDIIRTGLTHSYILKSLRPRRPNSINLCVLIDCTNQRLVDLPIRYRGYEMGSQFLIGYGLDYKEKYRNLPYIAEFLG